jgi:hypothetical protein
MQNEYMAKEAVITVRIPITLKQMIEIRAKKERRSLSSQVASYLERSIESEPVETDFRSARLLGLYEGVQVPTEADFATARRKLWASLGRTKASVRSRG